MPEYNLPDQVPLWIITETAKQLGIDKHGVYINFMRILEGKVKALQQADDIHSGRVPGKSMDDFLKEF